MDVTIIGHGSLMSGRGLSFSGVLRVREAFVVALANCRRGFAKLSRYGDRFATDLEVTRSSLAGRQVAFSPPTGEMEGLALTVSLDDAYRLSQREGYSPAALQQLAETARSHGLNLAEFLWRLQVEAEHNVVTYRQRLFTLTGYTSPHYIPHPVRLENAACALVFLAPGLEGTGSDEVVSIRQQTGVRAIMSAAEAWGRKSNEDQLSYFLSCLLGGVHGVNVRDLLPADDEHPHLAQELRSRLQGWLETEREHFLNATGFTPERYKRSFGEPDGALMRSGLNGFLKAEDHV